MFAALKKYFHDRKLRKIESNIKYIKNPKAIREDRQAALEFFSELEDDVVATRALLNRFEYSLEHGINDTREKEVALKGIAKRGEKVIPIIVEHLQTTSRIAWPIKTLNQITSDEYKVISALQSCLDYGDIAFDQAKVDKNFDILCYLRDYKLPNFVDKLTYFLNFPDERVRFASIEILLEQDEPEVPSLVEHYLHDQSAENTRLRQATIEAFIKHGWKIKKPESFTGEILIPGVRLDPKNLILSTV